MAASKSRAKKAKEKAGKGSGQLTRLEQEEQDRRDWAAIADATAANETLKQSLPKPSPPPAPALPKLSRDAYKRQEVAIRARIQNFVDMEAELQARRKPSWTRQDPG